MKSECDRDLLRIATVGNRWELLLPPAKLTLHFLTLKKRNFQQRRVYVRRNRIKRLFNETLTPTTIDDNVNSQEAGIKRVRDWC